MHLSIYLGGFTCAVAFLAQLGNTSYQCKNKWSAWPRLNQTCAQFIWMLWVSRVVRILSWNVAFWTSMGSSGLCLNWFALYFSSGLKRNHWLCILDECDPLKSIILMCFFSPPTGRIACSESEGCFWNWSCQKRHLWSQVSWLSFVVLFLAC